ncbi:hypothetical protein TNCT_398701, partial [Trichonephila clavata]
MENATFKFFNDDAHDGGGDRGDARGDDDDRDDGDVYGDGGGRDGDRDVHDDDDVLLPSQRYQEQVEEQRSRIWQQGWQLRTSYLLLDNK